MPKRIVWEFIEQGGRSGGRWRWRQTAEDGSHIQSDRFSNYAAAIHDAIRHGFQPDREPYAVTNPHGTTIHQPAAEKVRLRGPTSTLRSSHNGFLLPDPARRLLRKQLDAAIAALGAAKGSIQVVARDGTLEIILQRGFRQPFLRHFQRVRPDDGSACGRAFHSAQPILIADVQRDQRFAPHRAIATSEGFRAVQSVPLFDSAPAAIGVLSIHYVEPLPFPEWRLARLTESARIVASLLEQHRVRPAQDESATTQG